MVQAEQCLKCFWLRRDTEYKMEDVPVAHSGGHDKESICQKSRNGRKLKEKVVLPTSLQ